MIKQFQTLGNTTNGPAVMLVPQAAYHLAEFLPLRDELLRQGVAAELVVPIPPRKPLNRIRPGMRRHIELLAASREDAGAAQPVSSIIQRASALVVMNDWGITRPLVEAIKQRDRPTFAWVEGVQDFDDVDTGRSRRPYRTVDHVFCLGRYDQLQLDGADCTVVGSTRFRELWSLPPAQPTDGGQITINSNFTYGVFPEARRAWVADAVGACRSAGVPWELSRHAAERGPSFPYRVSRTDVGELLAASSHLISRFSTLGYEALVRGVQLLYHNPHGEKVATFTPLDGAVTFTRSHRELIDALRQPLIDGEAVRRNAEAFISEHLRLDDGEDPARLAADMVAAAIAK